MSGESESETSETAEGGGMEATVAGGQAEHKRAGDDARG